MQPNSKQNRYLSSNLYNLCINGGFVVNTQGLHLGWDKIAGGNANNRLCDLWQIRTNVFDVEVKVFANGYVGVRGNVEGHRAIVFEHLDRRAVGVFNESEKNYITSFCDVQVGSASVPITVLCTPKFTLNSKIEQSQPVVAKYGSGNGPFRDTFTALSTCLVPSTEAPLKGLFLEVIFDRPGYFEFYVFNAREFLGVYSQEPVFMVKNPMEELADCQDWYYIAATGAFGAGGGPPDGWDNYSGFPYPSDITVENLVRSHENLFFVDSGLYRHLTVAEAALLADRGLVSDASSAHSHGDNYVDVAEGSDILVEAALAVGHNHHGGGGPYDDDIYYHKSESYNKFEIDALIENLTTRPGFIEFDAITPDNVFTSPTLGQLSFLPGSWLFSYGVNFDFSFDAFPNVGPSYGSPVDGTAVISVHIVSMVTFTTPSPTVWSDSDIASKVSFLQVAYRDIVVTTPNVPVAPVWDWPTTYVPYRRGTYEAQYEPFSPVSGYSPLNLVGGLSRVSFLVPVRKDTRAISLFFQIGVDSLSAIDQSSIIVRGQCYGIMPKSLV